MTFQVMEQMLTGFQSDLSSISHEIKALQDQSVQMNIKLKNQQAVKGELSQFVDEMVVNENMIRIIMDSQVTDRSFLEQLHELNHKLKFVKQQSTNSAKSCSDVIDILEKLKFKVVCGHLPRHHLQKIREFFLQKINQFRKPMTNYHVPQNALLKFRFFNEFLMSHERNVSKEIRDEYLDTMSKVYWSYFKGYATRVMKLQFEEVADKDDMMAAEDPSLKNRSTIFSIGNRGNILNSAELEGPVIVAHSTNKYPYESLFRSHQYALLDNCCREFFFISDFFVMSSSSSSSSSLELFNLIFAKTLSFFVKQTESYVGDCHDSIAIFLCMQIVHKFKAIMQMRGAPVLDKYYTTLHKIMEPRFEQLLLMNIQSVKECDPHKMGHIDVRPHYITRRFAEFTSAVVGFSEAPMNERTQMLLMQLQSEIDNLLLKMATNFSNNKQQLVFLINNYDIIISVVAERTTDPNSKECHHFKDHILRKTQEYVEEVLLTYFRGIITFVKDFELKDGVLDCSAADEKRVVQLVRGFNSEWKKSIDSINQEIMRTFSNFKNGTQILQATLTQLIQYYHLFHKVLSQRPFASYPVRGELINIHNVMVEVKKYKPNF
ncbi:hypothetical protein HELRODRAFT_102862 [Helobdella robusta]|uniref:Vacuolar protein sorting-associated protein 52 homolog n=1 Tax=Helobdella robusta TaxID=6412 RepID=T1EDC5_HELRO|nr:hypothetical protein HELRODRAFT_102862 [Helobdella robusta]ESN95051.1 hypothetical protein HELRODRAFT_102862 [Helobdella robusta]